MADTQEKGTLLVTCIGNICRSPMAALLLKTMMQNSFHVESAGIAALVGEQAHEFTRILAQKNGLSLEGHKARQITEEMAQQSDLIFAMTEKDVTTIEKMYPFAKGRVYSIGEWGEGDVEDPYGKAIEDFDTAFVKVERCLAQWKPRLNKFVKG
ncbi:MAG: low molecular weight phosphotyrosine protein phosphatase [Fibrobacterales bacterium]